MEFPVLFLGALPQNTPALYSLMNYADIKLGTWYPMGGMHKIVEALLSLATELGVEVRTACPATAIALQGSRATGVLTAHGPVAADSVLAAADYHHVEQHLLPPAARHYTPEYWQRRTLAPGSLIFYVGLDTQVPELTHHALFFDADFQRHAREIYAQPQWPTDPLFYTCTASRTDPTLAPPGGENLFILIPTAVDLPDDDATRQRYFDQVMQRLEARTGRSLRPHVVFCRSYAHRDFVADYHSFRGNAYGLANTLRQTALLKPKLKSPKVKNLYFAGQLTVPGPGVPPSLISGEVAALQLLRGR
jgi:phytoene desaturase